MSNTIVLLSNSRDDYEYFKGIQPFLHYIKTDDTVVTCELLEAICNKVMTEYFYIAINGVRVNESFDIKHRPPITDKKYVHMWGHDNRIRLYNRLEVMKDYDLYSDESLFNHKTKLTKSLDYSITESVYIPCIKEGHKLPSSKYYYVIEDGYNVSNQESLPLSMKDKNILDTNQELYASYPVIDQTTKKVLAHHGLKLYKKDNTNKNAHLSKFTHCHYNPFDIFFIGYDEPFVDEHFSKVKERYDRATYIGGIKGIPEVHIECAKQSTTPYFYVLDADCVLLDGFDLDTFYPADEQNVYVWRAKNPLNGLIYGYGGVKLMSKKILDIYDPNKKYIDFATTIANGKFKSMPNVSNITAFHFDEFCSWKGAFREAVKLTLHLAGDDEKTLERLAAWLNIEEKDEKHVAARRGATLGHQFALENGHDSESLRLINDYDWLNKKFNSTY